MSHCFHNQEIIRLLFTSSRPPKSLIWLRVLFYKLMGKQVLRVSFVLKKSYCSYPGKSGSPLLTLPVHLVKLFPKGKNPSATRLPSAKPGHPQGKEKDSKRNRLSAIPWTHVHLKATAFQWNCVCRRNPAHIVSHVVCRVISLASQTG